ncbi:MAG: transglutaminase-like domain-containing protein [Thermodesulfobacteriota bacterium]
MNITQNGTKIGYVHRTLQESKEGFHYSESIVMRINTMGIVQPLTVRMTAELNADRTLSRFEYDLGSSLFRFRARGTIRGKRLTVHAGAPGGETITTITLAEVPYLGGTILGSAVAAGLRPGERMSVPVFDPASLGQKPVQIQLLEEGTLTVTGKPHRVKKLSVEFAGVRQTAWIDEKGSLLREEGILGITLEKVARETALAGLESAVSGDLAEIASIRSPRPIDNPETLKTLTLRVSGLPEGSLFLDGGRQSYRDGVLTIRRESMDGRTAHGDAARQDLSPYLTATPLIQSDHRKVRQTLGDILSPGDGEEVKARKILAWIHRHIEKRPVLSVPNALQTLENRVGDCNEHAVLMAALSRAAGIPADMEAGLVFLRGRFYYHAWNVLFLPEKGGWITADPVLGQMPADATHIRFTRGGADQQLDLVGLIGRLNLEILEMTR